MRLAAIVLAAALVALPRTARAQASPAPADSAAAAAAPNAIPTIDEGQLPVPLRPASRMETQNLIRRYYPASLLRTGGEGEAGVRVVVDEDGKVATAEVERSSGDRDIDRSALEVARRLHFPRPRLNAAPVRVRMLTPVRFMVDRADPRA